MKELIYFGCIRDAGHYFWGSETKQLWDYDRNMSFPGLNPEVLKHFDGVFTPVFADRKSHPGRYLESIVPPVRIVAWWDYSVDRRGGSNSALIGMGYTSAEEMIDAAVQLFPSVMKRQARPVAV